MPRIPSASIEDEMFFVNRELNSIVHRVNSALSAQQQREFHSVFQRQWLIITDSTRLTQSDSNLPVERGVVLETHD